MVAMPVGDFEALMETLDVLGNPAAMKALGLAREGITNYQTLDLDDPDFGL